MTAYGCDVHNTHEPRPLRIVSHHIWPLGMAGPDVPTNRVQTCDAGHMNTHRLLDDLLRDGKMRRGGSKQERILAQRGFDRWVAAGKPGHPVFESHNPEATA
jgi:hypothetical protein